MPAPFSPVSVAPMMDWTDRHCRYFHRLLAPDIHLYTEMVTTGALLHADPSRFLDFDAAEHPIALQLGGSEPADLAACVKLATQWGYDEVNLNCGCPSDRVQRGRFGACLMAEPDLVASCVQAMQDATDIPVTIKCRIAIDDAEEWPFLTRFIDTIVAGSANRHFIIHARKAWLQGLSPKENREVPPLRYDIAARVKQEYPDLTIAVNGGIASLAATRDHLKVFDSVMLGRAAYQNPWLLREIQQDLWPATPVLPMPDVLNRMADYIQEWVTIPERRAHNVTRHMLGLFQGSRGARAWRQTLSHLQTAPTAQTIAYLRETAQKHR